MAKKMPLQLDGTYQPATTIIAANPIMLYTKEGRLDNPALLTRFLARRPRAGSENFARADVPIPYSASLTLTIAGSRATLVTSSSPTKSDTIRAEIMARTDRSFVLAYLDSVGYAKPSASNRCSSLSEQVASVRAGQRCRAVCPPPAIRLFAKSGRCGLLPSRMANYLCLSSAGR
ncbi:MAG: hypothetical protein WKG07_48575 [Hymenobacter sp.]